MTCRRTMRSKMCGGSLPRATSSRCARACGTQRHPRMHPSRSTAAGSSSPTQRGSYRRQISDAKDNHNSAAADESEKLFVVHVLYNWKMDEPKENAELRCSYDEIRHAFTKGDLVVVRRRPRVVALSPPLVLRKKEQREKGRATACSRRTEAAHRSARKRDRDKTLTPPFPFVRSL